MNEPLLLAVFALGVYNTWVLATVRQTTRRLSDSVEVLMARSDINHDQVMRNKDALERHDSQLRQLVSIHGERGKH